MKKDTKIISVFSEHAFGTSLSSVKYMSDKFNGLGLTCKYITYKQLKSDKSLEDSMFYLVGSLGLDISDSFNKVDLIITDFPIISGYIFNPDTFPALGKAILELNHYYDCANINVFLKRPETKSYNSVGKKIKSYLDNNKVDYKMYKDAEDGLESIINDVLVKIGIISEDL